MATTKETTRKRSVVGEEKLASYLEKRHSEETEEDNAENEEMKKVCFICNAVFYCYTFAVN